MKQQPFYQTTAKFITAIMIVMLVLGALPATPARAVAKSWDGLLTGGVWTLATNWSDDIAPVAGDAITIPSDMTGNITAVPAISLLSLTINGNTPLVGGPLTVTGALSVASGKTLTLGSDTSVGDLQGSGTITNSVAMTLTINNTASATYSGVLSNGTGALSLTKSGAGTLTLSGASTYTGATTISAGVLKLGAAGSGANTPLGTVAAGTTVADGAALDLNGFTLATAEALTLNGLGIASGGALTNSSATAASYSGLITLGSSSSIRTDAGDINITNTGTITGAGFDLYLAGSGNGSLASVLGTGAGYLVKNGTGMWTVSGNSTYTGLTIINAGILQLGAAGSNPNTPLGMVTGGTTVAAGAALDLNGFTLGTAEPLTLNGAGISSGGALTNSSATAATYSGLITLGSDSRIATDAGDINLTHPGTITGVNLWLYLGGSGNGSLASILGTTTGRLIKYGTGTWTVSGNSTYTGITEIVEGTLKLGAAGIATDTPLGTTGLETIVTAGAALDLNGFALATDEPLTLNGTGILSGGALTNSSATAVNYTGLITLGSASSIVTNPGGINIANAGTILGAYGLTLGGLGNGSLVSILGTGTGSLTKSGAGTWTLSAANTFTGGTTLNAGKLIINNAAALGTVAGTFTITGGTIDSTVALITTLNYPQAWKGDFTFTGTQDLNLGTGAVTLFGGDRQVTVSAGTLTVGGAVSPHNYNLTKAGAGTLSFGANPVTLNGLTISAGTLISTSGTMSLEGNFTNNGTFTDNSGTVYFTGAPAQTIGGSTATTFNNLTIQNPLGITLGSNITVKGTLTFTDGRITTGARTLILPATAVVSSANTGSYVFGNVQRPFSGVSGYAFPIGDASIYAPVTLSFAGAGTSGNVTAAVTGASCGSPLIDQSKNVNHCWTLTNAVTGFTSYDATFWFAGVGTDADVGAATGSFIVGKYDSGTWTKPTMGAKNPTNTTAAGMTSMSSFEVGEAAQVPADKFVKGSDTNKAVSVFTLVHGSSTTVTGMTVTVTGTGLTNVAAVKIYLDNNANNEYDAGDTLKGTATTYSGVTGLATFTGLSIDVTTTATQYLITLDIIASPANGQTMLGPVCAATTPVAVTCTPIGNATLTVDSLAPTIIISAPSVASTTFGPVTYTVTYADAHFVSSTLAVGNITLNKTSTANGTVGVTGTGLTRTVTISSITGNGTLGISIAAGTASDLPGNLAPAAGPSTTFNVVGTTTTITNAAALAATPSLVGQPYAVNFTVASTLGTPTGSVTVSDGTVTCTGTLAAGAGTCNLTSTTAGVKTLTATYPGNATFNGSSGTATHTVAALTITTLSPTSATKGGAAFTLTVTGTGFVSGSTVYWNGASRVTTFGTSTSLTAAILAADIAAAGVPLVTVVNTAPAATSNGKPFFITTTGALVTGSTLATGVNPTATFGDVTATGTGTGTIVVAQYATNPGGTFPYAFAGSHYYDVHITPTGAFTQVIIQFCGLTASDNIYFWNGTAWVLASNQTFLTGCWTVTVNAGTVPNLTNLGGAVFGVGTTAPSVVSSLRADPNPTTAASVHFTVTFSEAVTGVDTADFTLTATGVTGASVTSVSGSLTIYTVNVNTGTGSGTLRLNVVDNDTIIDGSSNPLGGTGTGNGNYTSGETYDVRPTTFIDVPTTYWAWDWIERLYHAGVTTGCIPTSPMRYCPENNVTRAEMAVFLLRAKHTMPYTPPAVGASTGFTDVPISYWAAAWIKQLAAEGITTGCTATTFCPDQPVTRAEMAVFLLRSTHVLPYTPPAVGTSTGFADVPISYWAAAWIKQLAVEGITTLPAGSNYLPEQPVTRAEMAKFLVAAFHLP